ncbi:mannose/glucose-specific lectin-like [Vigna radiata var. radiata]|uniref:Mannose/glucose-specific lectin-like n=1 Tax=Vigna radiata var. radiata TaxID=3916 RepID=A0A1S3TIK1_VIGRR|nr:mannose/glucose-specific lectin-like [Vigna radiata var. radiata]
MAALYNTKPVFLLLIPLLMLHRSSDTSFNFPNFSGPYANTLLNFQGDAFASTGVIQLTEVLNNGTIVLHSAGRATYALPVRLWDAETGKTASFTTTFSFQILNAPTLDFGEGISFFIAPFRSDMPRDAVGGYLGLFSPHTALKNTSGNHIVAVEFDMQRDEWDPPIPHIGIDINSISSVTTEAWENKQLGVATVSATVAYDPVAQNLSAIVSNDGPSIGHVIDLTTVLPEWVSVGFSGATGQLIELHKILSWTFSSSFN